MKITEDWTNAAEEKPPTMVPVLAALKNDHGKWRVIRAEYAPHKGVEDGWYYGSYDGDDIVYDDDEDKYYWPEGWYECNEYEETHWRVGDEILMWSPLPYPKEAQKEATE